MAPRCLSQSLTALAPSYAKPNLLEQNSCGLIEVPVGCLSEIKIG